MTLHPGTRQKLKTRLVEMFPNEKIDVIDKILDDVDGNMKIHYDFEVIDFACKSIKRNREIEALINQEA